MKRFPFGLGLAAGLGLSALFALGRVAVSEEGKPSEEEMMKKWMEMAAPGEHHKALGYYLGTWDVEMKVMMPGAPPQVTKGVAEYSWLMEGRWLQERLKGEMMGMPYEGFGIYGWDNFKKKSVACWVDSVGTAMVHAEGVVVDPTGKVSVLWAQMDEFLTGEHDKAVKLVHRIVGPDKYVFEIWDMGIGESGAAVMEFTCTRRK